jgi:hypothetical protein
MKANAVSALAVLAVLVMYLLQTSLEINLDINVLFTYANIILEALMPVVLISAGFALGMFILKQIASAFRRLG